MKHPISIAIQNNPYISKLFGFFFFGMVLKYCNIWYDGTGMLYCATLKKALMQNQNNLKRWIFMVFAKPYILYYLLIISGIFSRRRGGRNFLFFLFVFFFFYNLQIRFEVLKVNSECWYVVGIAVFLFCSIKISFIFFFVCFRGVSKHNTEQQCFFLCYRQQ